MGKTIIAINNRGFYVGTEASNAKATNIGFWKQQIQVTTNIGSIKFQQPQMSDASYMLEAANV